MSEPGYTHTTLSAHPGEPVRVGVSFYLDDTSWITTAGTESGKPLLVIAHGDVSVHFCPRPGGVTAGDARLARELADQAAEYAACLERLSAANTTAPQTGAKEAAGDPAA